MPPQTCTWCNRSPPPPLIARANTGSPADNVSAFTQCQTCKAVGYCSAQCQSNDEPHHALLCSTYTTFIASRARPSTSHKLALLIPEDGETPQFIWLKVQLHNCNWESPIFDGHLGPSNPMAQSIYINVSDPQDSSGANATPQKKATLIVDIISTYAETDPPQNQCIKKMVSPELAQQWKGPAVITLKRGPGAGASAKPAFYSDFNLGDMYKVQRFLETYILPGRDIIQGVRIRCLGEVNHLHKAAFSMCAISKDHDIFTSPDADARAISVSETMGVPLLIYNDDNVNYDEQVLTEAQRRAVQNDIHFSKNPAVMFLTLDTRVRSKNWGALDKMQWGEDTGNVVIARRDQKPLSPHQVEALVCYCRDVLYGAMQKTRMEEEGKMLSHKIALREKVTMRLLGKKRFEMYFEGLKKAKQICDGSWAQEKSLYSI